MAGGTIMKATVDHALMRGLVPADEIPVVHHPDRAEPDTQIIASLWDYRFGTQLPGKVPTQWQTKTHTRKPSEAQRLT
jgi:hypothetical protein